jgi:hypothetical protein
VPGEEHERLMKCARRGEASLTAGQDGTADD